MDHGATVLFWNETLLSDKLPRLYSYARDKTISGAKFLTQENILTHFHLPLSLQAYQELSKLQSFIQQIQMPQNPGKDIWHYQWGNSYTSTKLYHFPYRNFHPPKPFIWIWLWVSKCSNKLRVFVWLLLTDRLNTSLLKRKKKSKYKATTTIVFYAQATEKKQPSTSSLHASSAKNVGNIYKSSGTYTRASTKWTQQKQTPLTSSWNSQLLRHATYGYPCCI
jgi:hypothetical protein